MLLPPLEPYVYFLQQIENLVTVEGQVIDRLLAPFRSQKFFIIKIVLPCTDQPK